MCLVVKESLTLSLLSASFLKKNEQFLLKNASNLTHEFFYENLTRKLIKIFMLKLSYKNSCLKFDTLSMRNGSFIFLKNEVLRRESVKYLVTNTRNT